MKAHSGVSGTAGAQSTFASAARGSSPTSSDRAASKCTDGVHEQSSRVREGGDTQPATRIASRRFDLVFIDEAGQATEPEALVPITTGAQRLVLIGDTKQLRPVVRCAAAARAGLGISLFERLRTAGAPYTTLRAQYRMHPAISAFPYHRLLRRREIRSDRGSNFISAAIRSLYSRMHIRIVDGTTYRHHLVALVERWHKTLKQLLQVYVANIHCDDTA